MSKSIIFNVIELSAKIGFGHKGVKVVPDEPIALQIDVPDEHVVGDTTPDGKVVFDTLGMRFILANLQAHLATEEEKSDY